MIRAALMIFILAAPARVHALPAEPSVQVVEGRLTIHAVELRLERLAEEITSKTGVVVEIKSRAAAENLVTLDLSDVALPLALQRVLQGFNFASYYQNGRLSRVTVFSEEAEQNQNSRSAPVRTSPPLARLPRRLAERLPDYEEMLHRNRSQGMEAIAQALKGSDQQHKLAALDALDSVEHPEVVRLLGEALNDLDETVRRSALKVLADKKGPAVVPLLTSALRDSDPSIRVEVLEALADREESQVMKTALQDSNEAVATRARELLEWLARRQAKRNTSSRAP